MNCSEWLIHARRGHRHLVFHDSTDQVPAGGFRTIEIGFRKPQQQGDPPRLEYVSVIRKGDQRDLDVEISWLLDKNGDLWLYAQAPFVPANNPQGTHRQAAMKALQDLYQTWLTCQASYRVEYPDDSEPTK